MKLKTLIASCGLLAMASTGANAQDFFDTSSPEQLITIGVRMGVNSSNQTSPSEDKILNLDSWGTGFDAGAVVNLNFKDFFALQPGVFFESRSHDYSYISGVSDRVNGPDMCSFGHTRSTWLKVPLLASVRMNPSGMLKWAVEAGPVFGFGMGGSDKMHIDTPSTGLLTFKTGYYDARKKWSFGWKLGTTLCYGGHYLVGVHYEAGTSQVYKDLKGGRHKAWMFTLGYDF